MNWLLMAVIIAFAIGIFVGYKKGMFYLVISLVSWLVIVGVSIWATPTISAYLTAHTDIEEKIQEKCEKSILEKLEDKKGEILDQTELSSMNIYIPPQILKKVMGESNIPGVDDTVDDLAAGLTDMIVYSISFLIILVLAAIIRALLRHLVIKVNDIPVIGKLNRVLGSVLASIECLIIIWIVFAIVAMNATEEISMMITSYVYESSLLTLLYENNLILSFLINLL